MSVYLIHYIDSKDYSDINQHFNDLIPNPPSNVGTNVFLFKGTTDIGGLKNHLTEVVNSNPTEIILFPVCVITKDNAQKLINCLKKIAELLKPYRQSRIIDLFPCIFVGYEVFLKHEPLFADLRKSNICRNLIIFTDRFKNANGTESCDWRTIFEMFIEAIKAIGNGTNTQGTEASLLKLLRTQESPSYASFGITIMELRLREDIREILIERYEEFARKQREVTGRAIDENISEILKRTIYQNANLQSLWQKIMQEKLILKARENPFVKKTVDSHFFLKHLKEPDNVQKGIGFASFFCRHVFRNDILYDGVSEDATNYFNGPIDTALEETYHNILEQLRVAVPIYIDKTLKEWEAEQKKLHKTISDYPFKPEASIKTLREWVDRESQNIKKEGSSGGKPPLSIQEAGKVAGIDDKKKTIGSQFKVLLGRINTWKYLEDKPIKWFGKSFSFISVITGIFIFWLCYILTLPFNELSIPIIVVLSLILSFSIIYLFRNYALEKLKNKSISELIRVKKNYTAEIIENLSAVLGESYLEYIGAHILRKVKSFSINYLYSIGIICDLFMAVFIGTSRKRLRTEQASFHIYSDNGKTHKIPIVQTMTEAKLRKIIYEGMASASSLSEIENKVLTAINQIENETISAGRNMISINCPDETGFKNSFNNTIAFMPVPIKGDAKFEAIKLLICSHNIKQDTNAYRLSWDRTESILFSTFCAGLKKDDFISEGSQHDK